MVNYEITETSKGETLIIKTNDDGTVTSFTADPANSDYQAYLKSLEEGTIS